MKKIATMFVLLLLAWTVVADWPESFWIILTPQQYSFAELRGRAVCRIWNVPDTPENRANYDVWQVYRDLNGNPVWYVYTVTAGQIKQNGKLALLKTDLQEIVGVQVKIVQGGSPDVLYANLPGAYIATP